MYLSNVIKEFTRDYDMKFGNKTIPQLEEIDNKEILDFVQRWKGLFEQNGIYVSSLKITNKSALSSKLGVIAIIEFVYNIQMKKLDAIKLACPNIQNEF